HRLPSRGEVVIGRGSTSDLLLDFPSVSRRHAILHIGSIIEIEDLGSFNGTRVRDVTLGKGERTAVLPGDSIAIGTVSTILQTAEVPTRLQRVWPHGYFEGRLDEECARGERKELEFTIAWIAASSAANVSRLEVLLTNLLRRSDVIGSYSPGSYEILLSD